VRERVAVVRLRAHDEVQVAGTVLAVGVALEAVADQGFLDLPLGAVEPEVEERVPAEPGSVAHDGGVGASERARDLAVARAGEDPLGGLAEDVRTPEPVVGGEGLRAEGGAAVATAETRDAVRGGLADERSVARPVPGLGGTMEAATGSRAVRGHEGGGSVRHASELLHSPCRQQSPQHNRVSKPQFAVLTCRYRRSRPPARRRTTVAPQPSPENPRADAELATTAEARAAGAWLSQLARTLKTGRLYDAANPAVVRFREELHQGLRALFEKLDELPLEIASREISFGGVVVYRAASREDNLAAAFHRDGIRRITFLKS